MFPGDGALLDFVPDPLFSDSISQRDAELLPLYIAVEQAHNGVEAEQASAALQQALDARSQVDEGVKRAVSSLLAQTEVIALLEVSNASSKQHYASTIFA